MKYHSVSSGLVFKGGRAILKAKNNDWFGTTKIASYTQYMYWGKLNKLVVLYFNTYVLNARADVRAGYVYTFRVVHIRHLFSDEQRACLSIILYLTY